MNRSLYLLPLLAVFVSCTSPIKKEQELLSSYKQLAAQAVMPFKKQLKAALIKGMAQGPVTAVAACNDKAPAIAAEAAVPGIRMGRTSHKLRNTDNAPNVWQEAVMNSYRAATGPAEARIIRIDKDFLGYTEPLYMKPMCLSCHGAELSPALQQKIESLYPSDGATGFTLNEFRGLVWAEIDTRKVTLPAK